MTQARLRKALEQRLDHALLILRNVERRSYRKSYMLGTSRAEVRCYAEALTLLKMKKGLYPGYQHELSRAVKRTGGSVLSAIP